MRLGAFLLTLLLAGAAAAQPKSKWVRVYTFDDSIIEMEEIKLSFGNFGRVRFRTIFDKSRPLPGKPGVKFKTIVEDLEIQCKEQEYRLSSSVYLDAKGAPVHVYKAEGDGEWQELRSLMMQRLLDSACRMIEKKRL